MDEQTGRGDAVEGEWLRAYHTLQYERVAQHEAQRLQLNEFAIAVTGAVFALANSTQVPGVSKVRPAAMATVIAVNVFAMLFALQERHWIKMHQRRARAVRARAIPLLNEMEDAVGKSTSVLFKRVAILCAFHSVLALLATWQLL